MFKLDIFTSKLLNTAINLFINLIGKKTVNKYLLSLLLLAPLTTVIAQESNEKEEEAAVEEVVVTGIRSSLKNAIDI